MFGWFRKRKRSEAQNGDAAPPAGPAATAPVPPAAPPAAGPPGPVSAGPAPQQTRPAPDVPAFLAEPAVQRQAAQQRAVQPAPAPPGPQSFMRPPAPTQAASVTPPAAATTQPGPAQPALAQPQPRPQQPPVAEEQRPAPLPPAPGTRRAAREQEQPEAETARDAPPTGGHTPSAQLPEAETDRPRMADLAVPKARPSMPLSASPNFAGLGLARPEPVSPELLEPTAVLSEEARAELQALLMDMFGPEGRYRLEWRADRTPGDDRTFSQIMVADLVRRIQNAIAAADGLELSGRPSLAEILAADDAAADAHLRELAAAVGGGDGGRERSADPTEASGEGPDEGPEPGGRGEPEADGAEDRPHAAESEPGADTPPAESSRDAAPDEAKDAAEEAAAAKAAAIAAHDDAVIDAVMDMEGEEATAEDELSELVQQTHPGPPAEIRQQRRIA